MKIAQKVIRQKNGYPKNNRFSSGFTLLEIVLVLAILGVVSVSILLISNSIQDMGKVSETKKRMTLIAERAKEFYRTHENLPSPGGSPADSVPVGVTELNLEQKYRLDAWGKYFHYRERKIALSMDIGFDGTNETFTDTYITAINVDGKLVAGVLISSGPNQTFDYQYTLGEANYGYPVVPYPSGSVGSPAPDIYSTAGDDILIPINVEKEAEELALMDLSILQDKVRALDALYEGQDNGSTSMIDDDGCVRMLPWGLNLSLDCPATTGTNDPNCGRATLDFIQYETGYCYGCQNINSPLFVIIKRYSLGDPGYRRDPWLINYQWGAGSQPGYTGLPASDRRYHKFYSRGSDQVSNTVDDIVP